MQAGDTPAKAAQQHLLVYTAINMAMFPRISLSNCVREPKETIEQLLCARSKYDAYGTFVCFFHSHFITLSTCHAANTAFK